MLLNSLFGKELRSEKGVPLSFQFLWHCPYPWDVRLEKIIQVCLDMDAASVGLICRNSGGLPEVEDIGKLRVHRVGAVVSRLAKLWSYPVFFSPLWWEKATRVMHENSPSALIVRDIPLAMTAIWLSTKFRIPVILDMAENYPAALIAYENPIYKPFLIANAFLPRAYERTVVKRVDHILVVAEEQIERLCKLGVPQKNISVIRNTPCSSFFANFSGEFELSENNLSSLHPFILYTGNIDIHRGVELMIRAMPEVLKNYPKGGLVLVGEGKEKRSLESLVNVLGLQDHVFFTGWVDHDHLPAYIRASSICCIPHLKSEHTDTTIPNKLFDYMALGKPVVSSNLDPVRRIVENVGCGQIFENGNPRELAKVLVDVTNSPRIEEMGQRGMDAVTRDFNWNVDALRLKDFLIRFLASNIQGGST